MFAPFDVQNDRVNTCRKCKFYKQKSKTCGTPLLGNEVKFNKKNIKLCGCFMDVKTRFRFARCPANKWRDDHKLTEVEYKELKELLSHTIDKVTGVQNKQIAILHRKYLNSNANPSSCRPCVISHINDLHKVIDQYEG